MLRLTVLLFLSALPGLLAQTKEPNMETAPPNRNGEQLMVNFMGTLIAVDDIARSRRFYEQLLGQKVKFDHGRDVAYEGGFSIHQSSHFQSLLGETAQRPLTKKANNGELYFDTDELDAFCRRLAEAGVESVHGIREQPWGQRVARFYDPDGHIVEIGEPMEVVVRRFRREGKSVEDIARKTSLPRDFVEGALRNGE
jgi:catechol 2,3-dioxygenase-like lactoylglutathione lyase family enzyme